MDYELARALKDAGFHQEGRGTRVAPPDKIVARRDDFVYVPTLEELIGACPSNRFTLQKTDLNTHPHEPWVAKAVLGNSADGDRHVFGNGATHIEAVARLWLALNK